MSVLIVLFTTILLLLSAFVVLIILMQKPSANAGMGSALGGGAAEQAFGGEAANVLTRTTVFSIIGFFVLSFALYLGNIKIANTSSTNTDSEELQSLVSSFADEVDAKTVVEKPETPVVIDEEAAVSLDSILDDSPKPTPEESTKTTPEPVE